MSALLTREKHGLRHTSEYNSWRGIRQRILNPTCRFYSHYGGRGLTMDEEWANSFSAFYRDMGKKPSPQHSIERIDNNRGYYPDNCIWANKSRQAINRRQKTNQYGITGIAYHHELASKPWQARITVERKRISLGYFETRPEAVQARLKAEELYDY